MVALFIVVVLLIHEQERSSNSVVKLFGKRKVTRDEEGEQIHRSCFGF